MRISQSIIDTFGFAAAAGTTFSIVPQIIRIWRLKSARDISLGMFLLFSVGVALWLLYGILVHAWPVMIANALTLVFSMVVLALKRRFDRNDSDLVD